MENCPRLSLRILALDLALTTGWAHSNGNSGIFKIPTRRGDSPGMRWINFRVWLLDLLEKNPVDLIAYEQATSGRSQSAIHVAHSLISVTEEVAAQLDVQLTSRSNMSIKTHALGKGRKRNRRGKIFMVQAAHNKWDIDIEDDNHADALWLLSLVQEELKC